MGEDKWGSYHQIDLGFVYASCYNTSRKLVRIAGLGLIDYVVIKPELSE